MADARRARAALGMAGALWLAAPVAAAPAEQDWTLHCRGCHGAAGEGAVGAVPSLADVSRFLRVPGGRGYLVQVPGVAQAPLDDAALAALLNWMIAAFDAGARAAGFVPYDAAEVERLRAVRLADPVGRRRALVAALAAAAARGEPAPAR